MFIPRSHQIEALDAVQAARDRGLRTALAVMASGLGKTVTVAFDNKRWRERYGEGRMLYLCHNNDILYQAKTTFEMVHGPDKTYGYFHGEEKHFHHVDFLFASLQTMERHRELFTPEEFAYIVVDESHHSQAETFGATIKYFRPQFLFGVTATPDRLDELDIREIFGTEVYYLPLEEAMVRGLLTPVDYRILTDEIQLSDGIETGNGRASLAALNRSIFIPKRDEEIAKIIMRHASEFNDPRIITFCNSIRHCEHLAQFLPNSFAIHSKVPDRERAVKLEMFRQGDIGTILTVDAFNEGIDIPEANVVSFLRSTTSRTIFLQQLGRGLRTSDGKDKMMALDFVANIERIKMVHGLWKSVKEGLDSLTRAGVVGGIGTVDPMTLNVESVEFTETIVPILNLMERVRPKRVSEVPHLLVEYSSKNLQLATEVFAGTASRLWWKCSKSKCGHEWQAKGSSRYRADGKTVASCPACSGRVVTSKNNLAVTHKKLAREFSPRNGISVNLVLATSQDSFWWNCSKCGYEWRREMRSRVRGAPCPSCACLVATEKNNLAATHPHLVVEYSKLNKRPVAEVMAKKQLEAYWECSKCEHFWQARVASRARGAGCPGCLGRAITDDNNLGVAYPELVPEYSPRNQTSIFKLHPNSIEIVGWVCLKCKHEWNARPVDRGKKGTKCPACRGRVATPDRCLRVTHPELAKEYSDRNPIPADRVVAGFGRKVWWKCSKLECNGFEWQATGAKRVQGRGCPNCKRRKLSQPRGPRRKKVVDAA